MSHIPTKEQERLFNSAIRAIKKCRSNGLQIYAKQYELVAYTDDADDYADEFAPLYKANNFGTIPFISSTCLTDSGADDYACYKTENDQEQFNPHGL